jgi:phosphatidylinositol-3-phosphatase
VPLTRLSAALASASATPNLAFITPNLCHDGHDSPCVDGQPGGLKTVNTFLSTWVARILHSPAYRSGGLLAILFDEADGNDASACCNERKFPNTTTNGDLARAFGDAERDTITSG